MIKFFIKIIIILTGVSIFYLAFFNRVEQSFDVSFLPVNLKVEYYDYNSKTLETTNLKTSCKIPSINPFQPQTLSQLEKEARSKPKLTCLNSSRILFDVSEDFNLIKKYQNSDFWITTQCCFFGYGRDTITKLENKTGCIPIPQDSNKVQIPIEYELVDMHCTNIENRSLEYRDQFLLFRLNPKSEDTITTKFQSYKKKNPSKPTPNILFIGVDSVSHVNFQRYMPLTRNFILQNLSAIEFFGQNKVSTATQGNLIPVLTGCKMNSKTTGPESYKANCPLIWTKYSDNGYRTLRSEDDFGLFGSFYPVLKPGKKGTPQTHYDWLPYLKPIKNWNPGHGTQFVFGCFTYNWVQGYIFDRVLQVAKLSEETKSKAPYFNFLWTATTSHDITAYTKYLDQPMFNMFQRLDAGDFLNNTIVVLMSDHGIAYGNYPSSYEGSIEARMPFLYFIFPKWFQETYTSAIAQMKVNTRRLTTPFDLHETLVDLLDIEENLSSQKLFIRPTQPTKNKGISLFQEIPVTRTCESANIPEEWCICWSKTTISDPNSNPKILNAVKQSMSEINLKLAEFPECSQLSLHSIRTARRINSKLKLDKKSKAENFEVIFETMPSHAEFEVNVLVPEKQKSGEIKFIGEILRVNQYGNQSWCLEDKYDKAKISWIRSACFCIL